MLRPAAAMCAALFLVGCGGGGGGGAGGGGVSYPAPTVVGAYGFDAGTVSPSTQTSGGGQMPGDNMHVSIDDSCTGLGNKSVSIDLYSHDHSMLAAGTFQVERPSSGTAGNLFGNVSYSDFGSPGAQLSARSGTVTFDNLDFASLQNNRGSFSVQLALDDGGTAALSGSFDGRYLCH